MTSAAKNYSLTLTDIIKCTAEYCGISSDAIVGASRHPRSVLARRIVIVLARAHTTYTFAEIGQALGYRTHSTLIGLINQADANIEQGKMFRDRGQLVTLSDLFVSVWAYCQNRRFGHTDVRRGCVEMAGTSAPVPRLNELGRELDTLEAMIGH